MIDYAITAYCLCVYGYTCVKWLDERNSMPARGCWFAFSLISVGIASYVSRSFA